MSLNKKAQNSSMESLGNLIMIIFAMMIILMVAYNIIKGSNEYTDEIICRSTVEARAAFVAEAGPVKKDNIFPLACKTEDMGLLKGEREEIKEQISNAASVCWDMYGRGQYYDIFSAEEEKRNCRVCYTFSVKEGMDKGVVTGSNEVLSDRDPNKITREELSTYMIQNIYKPSVFFGGSKTKYFSAKINFEDVFDFIEPETIELGKIGATPLQNNIKDYSKKISDETMREISDISNELNYRNYANMLILIADRFEEYEDDGTIQFSDTIEFIEKPAIGLNSKEDTYDSILVLVDLDHAFIRITIGKDLQGRIKDFEVQQYLDKFKAAVDEKSDFEPALLQLINNLNSKLHPGQNANIAQDAGMDPESHFFHMTAGLRFRPIIEDITSEREYSIAFASDTNEVPFLASLLSTGSQGNWYFAYMDSLFTNEGLKRITGAMENTRQNNILILPTNKIDEICDSTD